MEKYPRNDKSHLPDVLMMVGEGPRKVNSKMLYCYIVCNNKVDPVYVWLGCYFLWCASMAFLDWGMLWLSAPNSMFERATFWLNGYILHTTSLNTPHPVHLKGGAVVVHQQVSRSERDDRCVQLALCLQLSSIVAKLHWWINEELAEQVLSGIYDPPIETMPFWQQTEKQSCGRSSSLKARIGQSWQMAGLIFSRIGRRRDTRTWWSCSWRWWSQSTSWGKWWLVAAIFMWWQASSHSTKLEFTSVLD